MPKRQNLNRLPGSSSLGWTLIMASILLILSNLFLSPAQIPQSQPYSKFIDLVESDRVEKVFIS